MGPEPPSRACPSACPRWFVGLGGAIAAFAAGVGMTGCAPHSTAHTTSVVRPPTHADCAEPLFGDHASFALDHAALAEEHASPKLVAKLEQSSYAYFRALARAYELRTCAAFREDRWSLPVAAIHGDAHVEQFVVTPETAGLEDFDQAGFGPAVVDLVRYAASLHITCRSVKIACDPERAVAAYVRAYRASLEAPPTRVVPAVAERLRRDTPASPVAWLTWAEGLVRPLPPGEDALARERWATFRQHEHDVHPERPPAFYEVVHIGALHMGVGSALETKLLFRIQGATSDPTDDLIVEVRSALEPSAKQCVSRPIHGGALQPLTFMSILGPRMPEVFGFTSLSEVGGPEFWIQSWLPGYRELSIHDLRSEDELVELAEDAARQLAGHFWTRFPHDVRAVQRRAQLVAFDRTAGRIPILAREFAIETIREWDRFRASH